MPLMRVGEVSLYYRLTDYTEPWRAAPAPVVFLHGLGGDHSVWLYQVPELCSRLPVITLDLRGHGRSTIPERPFGMAAMALDVARLLRELGAERAHIVGLSLGGMVAQQFALDHPQAVASLVLADTLCATPDSFRDVAQASLQFIEQNDMATVAQSRITAAFSDHVDPVLREYVIDRIARNDKAAYLSAARAAFSFAAAQSIHAIQAPTLVLCGEDDRVTPLPLSEEIAARIPGARLARIAGAGHISNLERPREFNRIVLEFLTGVGC